MSIYVRPTKSLCLLTVAVVLFAAISVTTIALTLGQKLGRIHAVHVHKYLGELK